MNESYLLLHWFIPCMAPQGYIRNKIKAIICAYYINISFVCERWPIFLLFCCSVKYYVIHLQSLTLQKLGMEARLVGSSGACRDGPGRSFLAQQRHVTNTRRNLTVKVPGATSDWTTRTMRETHKLKCP